MQIFKYEIEDGLEHALSSSASISYASVAEPCVNSIQNGMKHIKSLASINDNDLYYVQSILVSSSWNKNDDIFDKAEVWLARNTPEDKPTNLEHDEATIIGHITANWPITEDGKIIAEDTSIDSLPEKYHILTGSVIYKGFSNQELRERSEKLISEIESGTKYVSMECFFKGFDYGLINKSTGEYKILTRNDSTAYLTKYLRSYGGLGEHDNYKIGRVLRQITFSGKGYVDKPANPDSVIFSKELLHQKSSKILTQKNEDLSIAGVSNFQSNLEVENITMSSEQEVQTEAQVEAETTANTEVQVAETTVTETEAQTQELSLAEVQSALESLKAEKEEAAKKMAEKMSKKEEEMMKKEKEMEKMKAELEAANEVIAAYKNKEEEMMKKEKKMKRVSSLVEAGIDNETAVSTVDQFESVNDDSFAALTQLLAAKKMKSVKKDEEMKEEEDKAMMQKKTLSSETVDASILDTAEVQEEVNLGVGGELESSVEATRAALVEFVCSRLGKKL